MNKFRFTFYPIGRPLFQKIGSLLLLAACSALFSRCGYEAPDEAPEYRIATDIALNWNDLALELERHTLGYRPPVSARNMVSTCVAKIVDDQSPM